MARYNTPVRDWNKKLPPDLRSATRRQPGIGTIQQGVTIFGRKKKNACKLGTTREIRNSINATQDKVKVATYRLAFPKINLKDASLTPRVVVTVPAPKKPEVIPIAKPTCLDTVRW